MNFLNTHLLSLILFLPTIAALVMLFLPSGENETSPLVCFWRQPDPIRAYRLCCGFSFDPNKTGFQFQEQYIPGIEAHPFIPPPRRGRHFADDGPADHAAHAACHPGFVQHH